MARHRSFNNAPGNSIEDLENARKATLERKLALSKKMAEMTAKKAKDTPTAVAAATPMRTLDVDAYMTALTEQPFHRLGQEYPAKLTPAYEAIVRSATKLSGQSATKVMMPWPPSKISPSAVASLLTIAAIGSAAKTSTERNGITILQRERADKVHILVFPYARSTHAPSRQVQVNRHNLGQINFEHLSRYWKDQHDDAAKDFHQVLTKVRDLNGLAFDGCRYAEFEHPILDEIIPHGPARGERPSNSSLLWRSRKKTDIGKHARSKFADDPSKAEFFMYTMRRDDRVGVEIRHINKNLNLLYLDLTLNARIRLGWDWIERAKEIVRHLREVHPSAGILAVVDDPWIYRTVRFEVLGKKRHGKKGKTTPAPGEVIYSPEAGILQDCDQQSVPLEGASLISVDGFFGDVDRNIESLRHLARRLSDKGDPASAVTARNLIGTVRRSASLPGSISELSQFIERETTTAIAADYLAAYRVTADLSTLADPAGLASQLDAESGILATTRHLMRDLEKATPMATLIEEAIQPALRSSSRSVFVFRSDMIAEFAADTLGAKYPKLVERIDGNMIRFGGARVLSTISSTPTSSRNEFKRAIIVAPTSTTILSILSEAWLPQHVVFLADADTLAFAARDAARLADEIGVEALASRLNAFAARADARVNEIGRHTIKLDSEVPFDDVEFPAGQVVDLSGGGKGEKRLVEIGLSNGQRIIARPSTGLVLRDDGTATTTFVERPASQVKPGDEVCIIGPGFIERARSLVNIRATAAEEIREYHNQVAKRFNEIPGGSTNGRLRVLVERMGKPEIPIERARYWIALTEQIDKPLHEVVPHAPQDRDTFLRFTSALGIGDKLAQSFWLWAVVAQRSHRMRAGNLFYDAFRGILTDPHAALASNKGRSAEIRALRAMADEHVGTVAEIRSIVK